VKTCLQVTATIKGCDNVNSSETILVLVDKNIAAPSCQFIKGPDVKPILDVSGAVEFCEDKIFGSIQEAKQCVMMNSNALDAAGGCGGGCRPTVRTVDTTEGSKTCDAYITVSDVRSDVF
jgi:predicted secreted protein